MSSSANPEIRLAKPKRPITVTIALLLILIVAASPIPMLVTPIGTHAEAFSFTAEKYAIIPAKAEDKHNLRKSAYGIMTNNITAPKLTFPLFTDNNSNFDPVLIFCILAVFAFTLSPILFSVFAGLMLMRIGWVRIIYTLLGIVTLPALAVAGDMFEPPIIAFIIAGLMIISIILLFLPASNRWFKRTA